MQYRQGSFKVRAVTQCGGSGPPTDSSHTLVTAKLAKSEDGHAPQKLTCKPFVRMSCWYLLGDEAPARKSAILSLSVPGNDADGSCSTHTVILHVSAANKLENSACHQEPGALEVQKDRSTLLGAMTEASVPRSSPKMGETGGAGAFGGCIRRKPQQCSTETCGTMNEVPGGRGDVGGWWKQHPLQAIAV